MVWVRRGLLCLLVVVLTVPLGFRIAAHLRESAALVNVVPGAGRLVETAGARVFVQEAGPEDGVPLLFAHGTGAWSGLWRPVLEEMGAQGYRAMAFDLPPFGFSERDEAGDYGRVRQAERVVALVRALEVQPVLVAHSFGAGPGMEAVMRAPGLFAGVVIVDGALGLGSHAAEGGLPWVLRSRAVREVVVAATATNPLLTGVLLRPLIHRKAAATDDVVAVLQRPMVREGSTRAFAAWLPNLLEPERDALSTRAKSYGALSVPVAYVWGEEDTVTPVAQGRTLAQLSPGARLVLLRDVGHIPQIEDRAGFVQALKEALHAIRTDH